MTVRSMAMFAATVALFSTRAAEARGTAGDEQERQLIGVLQSDAPPQEKAIACKRLALCGTAAAVPALAPLLADEKLASWARIALEVIPGPAADAALREAMGKLQGKLRIGAVNSIAMRRDAKAVDGLARLLKGDDAEAASAAAAALGRIGGAEAVRILEPALAGGPVEVRSAAAEGCILCAERFLDEGKDDEAAKLYDRVRQADVPRQRVLEGTRGAILARKSAGIPMLLDLLKSEDKALFYIGLSTAREIPGSEATEALVAEIGRMAPERQALLVLALSDRGDPRALPALLEVIRKGPKEAGLSAMGAMEHIGNASCIPVLLKAAEEGEPGMAAAAKAALAKLPGPEVDADIAARLPQATEKARQILIDLVGQRRIESALPRLVPFVEDADAGVRSAAAAALGILGDGKQAPDLVRILGKTQDAGERAGLEKALMAIASRAGAECTASLMPLARSGDGALRVIALHALVCCGGSEALASVQAAIEDKEEEVRDEAVRTLSKWPNSWPEDAGVMEPLMNLARSGKKASHRILALRGALQHIQGNQALKEEGRLARLEEVLPLITRPEEKRLAIPILGDIPSGRALDRLAALTEDPQTSEEACSAIVSLAGKKDLKDATAEQRRKALTAAAEKTKNDSTRRKAQGLLKAVR